MITFITILKNYLVRILIPVEGQKGGPLHIHAGKE